MNSLLLAITIICFIILILVNLGFLITKIQDTITDGAYWQDILLIVILFIPLSLEVLGCIYICLYCI